MLNYARLPIRRDQEGSMIVALMVMLIIAGLTVAVTARALVTNHAGRQDQDFGAGLPAADSGISDALLQLDNKTAASTSGPCAGQSTACFYNSGGVGTNTWSYVAIETTAANLWTVRSRGVSNGREHDAVATLTDTYLFDYGIFTTSVLSFSGNSCPDGSLGIPIATGGTISSPCGSKNDCYLPSTDVLPACTPLNKTHPEPLPGTIGGPAFPLTENCPAWLSNLGGSMTAPPAGTYYCNNGESVSMSGTFTPVGQVIIYVGGTATLNLAAGDYNVNWPGADDPAQCTAVNFQIYSSVASLFKLNGHAPQMCGAFYTPLAVYNLPGDKWALDGSVVAQEVDFIGKPKATFTSPSLSNLTLGNWQVTSYHETGSTCTGSTC